MDFPFQSIHIAGTNGKGSTAAYTGGILRAAGYTCGVYTSPHVVAPMERISVNGVNIPEAELERLLKKYENGATFFHAYTDAAFDWFKENNVEYAVVETGLGGRLDPTNEITPKVGILTSIGLDHTDILGHDIKKIAEEKCGIIKPGMQIVTGEQDRGVMEVIKAACSEKNCPLSVIAGADIRIRERSLAGQRFDLDLAGCSLKDLHIRMYGVHQPQNAALAAFSAKLCGMGEKAIRQGLENVQTVSRFEVIPGEPTVILDGAHNVDSAAELRDTLQQYFKDKNIVLLTAVMADKDVEGILKIFAQFARAAITVRVDEARGADAGMLAEILQHYGVDARSRKEPKEAFRDARLNAEQNRALLVVSGSFYLTGAVRRLLLPSID